MTRRKQIKKIKKKEEEKIRGRKTMGNKKNKK
jgi:hypothetical protein